MSHAAVSNNNFEASDEYHISQNIQCTSDLEEKINSQILTKISKDKRYATGSYSTTYLIGFSPAWGQSKI
jgi:hypothetical protein